MFKKNTSEARILDVLNKVGTTKFKEIKEKTKLSTRTISKHLKEFIKNGQIEKDGREYKIGKPGITRLWKVRTVGDLNEYVFSQSFLFGKEEMAPIGTAFFKLSPKTELNNRQVRTLQNKLESEINVEIKKILDRYKVINEARIIIGYNKNKKII